MRITATVGQPVTSDARIAKQDLGGKKPVKTLTATVRTIGLHFEADGASITLPAYLLIYRADGRIDPIGLPGTVREALSTGAVTIGVSLALPQGGALSDNLAEAAKSAAITAALAATDKSDALIGAYVRLLRGVVGTDSPAAAETIPARRLGLDMLDPEGDDEEGTTPNAAE